MDLSISQQNQSFNQALMNNQKILEKSKVLILGQKPAKVDNLRYNVRVVLFDPETCKYCVQLFQKVGEYLILGGGVDGDESAKTAASRELIEETGYTDFKFIANLGEIVCYSKDGETCKERRSTGFLAILASEKNQGVELTQTEIDRDSTYLWQFSEEILPNLQRQTDQCFGYSYHLEFFVRAVKLVSELPL